MLVYIPRELRRNNKRGIQMALADVIDHLSFIVVDDGLKVARVTLDGTQRLQNAYGLWAVVMVNDAELCIMDLSAESISQHDQLHQRKDHGSHHQRRRAKELAHVAFHDGHHARTAEEAVHYLPQATGDVYIGASTVWSRNWRPV